MGLSAFPAASEAATADLVPLFVFRCGANQSDVTFGPAGWSPAQGGPCTRDGASPALIVHRARSGPSAADLVELEQWYHPSPSDHYVVSSAEGRADAAAAGYTRVALLGYTWPAPGTANATSRYGLPSISKDDRDYKDQNYWHVRPARLELPISCPPRRSGD